MRKVEIWEREKPRGKDIAAAITTILTVVFKLLIFASVIIVFTGIGMSWFILTLVILTGVGWVLGTGNVVYLYLLFWNKLQK